MLHFNEPDFIRKNIKAYELENVILETGNENIFIKDENKFIVDKYLLKNQQRIFATCKTLKTIDLSNLDFNEITTMKEWFAGCVNLKEIKFPKVVNCYKLKTMEQCFYNTGLTTIDLYNWNFNNTSVNFTSLATRSENLLSLKLPKTQVNSIAYLVAKCINIEEVVLPVTFSFYNRGAYWATRNAFQECSKLTRIDMREAKNTHLINNKINLL